MREKIEKILRESLGIKAKDIAKKINASRHEVNSFLYDHKDRYQVDENYLWSLKSSELSIVFPPIWTDCKAFEDALSKAGSPLDSEEASFRFIFPEGCGLLLETIARLMALSNQLDFYGKKVTLDFTDSLSTLTYLNRAGFFEHLSENVSVLPQRPITSTAIVYKGNSENLVEFGAIDPRKQDVELPKQLKASFVSKSAPKYSQAAFTVISELYSNVHDHSESPILGFVALQSYKGKIPHIQTVISDSGKGILGTLRPILAQKYPDIEKEISNSESPYEKLLLRKVFTKGRISQSEDDGRGLGLKRSSDEASQFDATVLVRQEQCEVKFVYKKGQLVSFEFQDGMPRIFGTHICFDFPLDQG